MSEWKTSKLGDLCGKGGIQTGPFGSQLHYRDYVSVGTPIITVEHLGDNYIIHENLPLISDEDKKRLSKYLLKEGDIVFSRVGSVDRRAVVKLSEKDWLFSGRCLRVRPNQDLLDSRFLSYFLGLPSFKEYIVRVAVGATMPSLNTQIMYNIPVTYPPLPTQRRIAAILSAYDDMIENNAQRIKALEQSAHDLYREWFVEFRFPGHESVPLVDSGTEYGMIPQGWGVVNLENAIELAYGKSLKADDRIIGNFPVYGSSGVVGFHNEYLVEAPGIIVGRKGNVGSVFWATKNFYPIDTVYYVNTELSLHYVYFNLKHQNFINNDAAVPGLSRRQAYSLPLVIPSADSLNGFDGYIEPIFEEVSILTEKNNVLREARDLLLPRLVSGQVDVSEIELEIGSEA